MHLLAAVDFESPLTWAILIGWIMSVVLHEFAHGLVGYLGGDYTIKERGGLTLNPIQYIDPVWSLLIPAIILMIGGVPLPGGVTYIRHDLLRSRKWESAVALAGPAMNFLLFLACAMPFHPKFGWVDVHMAPSEYKTWHLFFGAMALLQLIAMLINLIPIPPLDGFNAISPMLDPDTQVKLTTPPISHITFIVLFLILFNDRVMSKVYELAFRIEFALGFDGAAVTMMLRCLQTALWGR